MVSLSASEKRELVTSKEKKEPIIWSLTISIEKFVEQGCRPTWQSCKSYVVSHDIEISIAAICDIYMLIESCSSLILVSSSSHLFANLSCDSTYDNKYWFDSIHSYYSYLHLWIWNYCFTPFRSQSNSFIHSFIQLHPHNPPSTVVSSPCLQLHCSSVLEPHWRDVSSQILMNGTLNQKTQEGTSSVVLRMPLYLKSLRLLDLRTTRIMIVILVDSWISISLDILSVSLM